MVRRPLVVMVIMRAVMVTVKSELDELHKGKNFKKWKTMKIVFLQ